MKKLFLTLSGMVLPVLMGMMQGQNLLRDTFETVVVTAQFAPQPEHNAVYPVKRISSKKMEMKAATNLRELLQQELNIDLNQKSVFGTSVEIQGMSKENIKVLIDGVPVIGRLNGTIDLNQINLANIQRIEVIEGPVSVFYGTDAMGGVINLITKKGQDGVLDGSVSAYAESIRATNLSGSVGYKIHNNILRAGGGYYQFDGLSTTGSTGVNNWEARKQQFGNLMFLKSFKNATLRYNASLTGEKLIHDGEPNRRGTILDKDYFTSRLDNNLSFQGTVLGDHFIDATISYLDYHRYHNTYTVDPKTEERTLYPKDSKSENIVYYHYSGAKVQLGKSQPADKLNYAVGVDYFEELTTGSRILEKKQRIKTLAAFASVNYKWRRGLELQPAARYTWNNAYGSLLSPAFNAKLSIGEYQTLRFAYARGFRAPSIKELYLDFHISAGPVTYTISGNPDLDVEKSHSFNLYYSMMHVLGNGTRIKLEPAVFYNKVDHLIALSQLVDNRRHYINIDVFRSLGGKLEVMVQPLEALTIRGGAALIGRSNKFQEQYDTEAFLYTPEYSSEIQYRISQLGLGLSLFYKYTGAHEGFYIDKKDKELKKTTTAGFSNMDVAVTKTFFKKSLSLTGGVKNVFDVKDIETLNQIGEAHARDIQLWGRSFFIKSIYKF